ncbi:TerC family protein [Asticcacaulis sp. EMRT-3]|uniref:TerC family protein n=1 Tax=Asticcacaulis sp. EMRT-3 TaxID=3040349 RepID=UPI0024AFFC00|nr:TerC family protein [Asticcacaulis sp. EMRT-3]MDI7775786.1 TerC family protein [Asticcacaulis sp. EMRT-3]
MDVITALILDPAAWAALLTLIVMEIVLGIDNLVFISILTNKLPEHQRGKARAIGMFAALGLRVALLGSIFIIVSLKKPIFELFGHGFSWRDLILIAGGLFLLYKAITEIIESTEGHKKASDEKPQVRVPGMAAAIVQILLLDLVFSVDSILTAVGMTDHLPIMIVAVLVAVGLMFAASGPISAFIASRPSIVMLALGFLLMIGVMLVMEGFGQHVDKGYIYAAMAFAGFIEVLQMLRRKAPDKD